MSNTLTSQSGQVMLLTRETVSSQTEQPALKISTFRFVFISTFSLSSAPVSTFTPAPRTLHKSGPKASAMHSKEKL